MLLCTAAFDHDEREARGKRTQLRLVTFRLPGPGQLSRHDELLQKHRTLHRRSHLPDSPPHSRPMGRDLRARLPRPLTSAPESSSADRCWSIQWWTRLEPLLYPLTFSPLVI